MASTSAIRSLAFSSAVALLLPGGVSAQFTKIPVEELRRTVEQKEQEFSTTEAALAKARAQLARAEGKKELAATEWRKVLAHHEKLLKLVEESCAQGRLCTAEPLVEARGAVAIDRAWIADLEDRGDDLRTELPKVIAYYESRIQLYERGLKLAVITVSEAEKELKDIRQELRWARDRLATLSKVVPDQDKQRKDQ